MPEPKFVDAMSKSTKKKQIVPAAWLDLDFPPFDDFTLPPSAKAKAIQSPDPAPDSKKEAK